MNYLCKALPKERLAGIICEAIPFLNSGNRLLFFQQAIKWWVFFDLLPKEFRIEIMLNMPPSRFDRFLVEESNSAVCRDREFSSEFLETALGQNQFIRAFRFCSEFRIEFVKQPKVIELANSGDWQTTVNVLSADAENWWTVDDNANLRFMGTSFSHAKLQTLALAVFVVLEEIPKLQALLLVDQELKNIAVALTKTEPNAKYTELSLRVVNEM
jgi:hypothetical protein